MTRGRWVVVGLALLAVALLATRPSTGGRAYDPRSTRPDGTRGLVLVLEAYGVAVQVATEPPDPGWPGRVLVLVDDLGAAARDGLLSWVERGGTLVVADPVSTLHGGAGPGGGGSDASGTLAAGDCRLPDLAGLRAIDVGTEAAVATYPVGPTDAACFVDGTQAFVLAVAQGAGTVVATGGVEPWTNRLLDRADNAALATELLSPQGEPVLVLERGPAGQGDRRLVELVAPTVWQALAQLGVAVVLLVAWRARRLGRPLEETPPVVLPGRELVRARAGLTRRAGHVEVAARALRQAWRVELAGRLGVPPGTDPATLDRLAAARGWSAPGTVAAVLDGPIPDEAALVALARAIDALRAAQP